MPARHVSRKWIDLKVRRREDINWREVVRLHEQEKLSTEAIAERFQCGPSTIGRILHQHVVVRRINTRQPKEKSEPRRKTDFDGRRAASLAAGRAQEKLKEKFPEQYARLLATEKERGKDESAPSAGVWVQRMRMRAKRKLALSHWEEFERLKEGELAKLRRQMQLRSARNPPSSDSPEQR